MRSCSIALLLICFIALASAQISDPNWSIQPGSKKNESEPTPGPVEVKTFKILVPGTFVSAFDQFTIKLLQVAEAKIPNFDLKKALSAVTRFAAAFSFLGAFPTQKYFNIKLLTFEKLQAALSYLRNLEMVIDSLQWAGFPGAIPEEVFIFGRCLQRIGKVLDLLLEKTQSTMFDSFNSDKIIIEQASKDKGGRRLKSLKYSKN